MLHKIDAPKKEVLSKFVPTKRVKLSDESAQKLLIDFKKKWAINLNKILDQAMHGDKAAFDLLNIRIKKLTKKEVQIFKKKCEEIAAKPKLSLSEHELVLLAKFYFFMGAKDIAKEYLILAYKKNNPYAYQLYGKLLEAENNFPEMRRVNDEGNSKGFVGSTTNIARCYYFSIGMKEKDDKEAFKAFKVAADAGDSYAKTKLGYMYENAEAVYQDIEKAFEEYSDAVLLGEPEALYHIARMGLGFYAMNVLDHTIGFTKNEEIEMRESLGIIFMRYAAEKGSVLAHEELLSIFNVLKDRIAAFPLQIYHVAMGLLLSSNTSIELFPQIKKAFNDLATLRPKVFAELTAEDGDIRFELMLDKPAAKYHSMLWAKPMREERDKPIDLKLDKEQVELVSLQPSPEIKPASPGIR